MRTIVKGKNVEVPDRVRDYAERKLRRLERLLDDQPTPSSSSPTSCTRAPSDAHIAEVTLVIDGTTLRSHAVGISYQAALDDVVDKVERQAVDYKSKPRLRHRPEQEKRILRSIADGTPEPGHERRIVKTKRFAIEPMFEEDAAARDGGARSPVLRLRQRRDRAIAILYAAQDGDLGTDRAGGRRRLQPAAARGGRRPRATGSGRGRQAR